MFYKKVSLVTGGFDPIHSGHISYFSRAKDFSDFLVVGLNTEEWLTKKKGQYFQSWKERAEIISHLTMVDAVITVPDDGNGGDRGKSNTPEIIKYGNNSRVQFEFGIGGDDKKNSSSWILKGYFERQRKLLGI